MQRIVSLVGVLAAVAFLVGSTRLGQLERSGPAHLDLELDGRIPATVYVPDDRPPREAFLYPPPDGERPPAVVLMHGFTGDRASLSSLARGMARAGYAVLAIDAAGHGANRNPFLRSRAREDSFAAELGAAVDFLRAWPHVDGARIAVGGFSMGAAASLDYATRDSGLDAVLLISGSSGLEGPHPPPNALFLVAEDDPERIIGAAREVAARLAGAPLDAGETKGRHDRHDAVRFQVIPGADHASIVWKEATLRELVAWLDAVFGSERSSPVRADTRLALLPPMLAAFVLLLPGLGVVVGRLVPTGPERPAEGRLLGLGLLAASLLLTLPLLAVGRPGALLGVEIGDFVGVHFGLAGLVALVTLRLRWPEALAGAFERPLASLAGAALAIVAVYVLMQPFGVVLHGLGLTPERFLVFLICSLAFLPLSLAASLALRRGGTAGAAVAALGARVLVLLVLILGVRFGVLGSVVLLMVPPLAGVSVPIEILATSLYASSRNLLVIALVDAAWLALVVAAIMPVRF